MCVWFFFFFFFFFWGGGGGGGGMGGLYLFHELKKQNILYASSFRTRLKSGKGQFLSFFFFFSIFLLLERKELQVWGQSDPCPSLSFTLAIGMAE